MQQKATETKLYTPPGVLELHISARTCKSKAKPKLGFGFNAKEAIV